MVRIFKNFHALVPEWTGACCMSVSKHTDRRIRDNLTLPLLMSDQKSLIADVTTNSFVLQNRVNHGYLQLFLFAPSLNRRREPSHLIYKSIAIDWVWPANIIMHLHCAVSIRIQSRTGPRPTRRLFTLSIRINAKKVPPPQPVKCRVPNKHL